MQVLNTLWNLPKDWPILGILVGIFLGIMWGWRAHEVHINKQRIKELSEKIARESNEKPVPEIAQVINGVRYKSLDANCLAQGSITLGWGWLMVTNNKTYFVIVATVFGELAIYPQTQEQAVSFFTVTNLKKVSFEEAFPGVKVTDA